MTYFDEFFEPYNIEHIKAYKHLSVTGQWPEGFLPEGIKFLDNWSHTLVYIMAEIWVEQALAGNVFGMPSSI